jgi:cellulose synthase (UDP-forming)
MSLPARLTYVSGFCYYLQTALATFAVPLIPICLLTFRPLTITPENSRLILIALAGSLALVPLWNRSAYAAHDTVPLTMARGWAHALAIWDYVRGKPMAWQASGAGVGSVRRFHLGTLFWNGSIALSWLALGVWRTVEYRSWQFVVVLALGSLYAAGTARILAQRRVLHHSDFRHTGGLGRPGEEPSGRRSQKPPADGPGPFRGWAVPTGGTVADSPNERREVTVD